jgi:hypothetical protein
MHDEILPLNERRKDLLRSTKDIVTELSLLGACDECRARFKQEYSGGRGMFWYELPAYFDCSEWPALKKQLADGQLPFALVFRP